jgi:hypothetical protein
LRERPGGRLLGERNRVPVEVDSDRNAAAAESGRTARKSLLQRARARPDLVRTVVRARAHRRHWPDSARDARAARRARVPRLLLGRRRAASRPEVEGLAATASQRLGRPRDHADVVAVPSNLVARMPDSVSSRALPTAMVGAIALHGSGGRKRTSASAWA